MAVGVRWGIALDYLDRGGIPRRHYANTLRAKQQVYGKDPKGGMQYLVSHPPTADRIRRFEQPKLHPPIRSPPSARCSTSRAGMPKTSLRTERFTESVIRKMTRVAIECGAINLSQGFPDFDPPRELLRAAHAAIDGPYHQYAITWGAENFRRALAEKLERSLGREVCPQTNLVVTCGSTEAMLASLLSLVNPHDKVIVFSPFYENYGADTILSGAEPIYVELEPPNYEFDREELRKAFAQGAKAIIVCNPSNPSGKVFTQDELGYILELANQYDAYVITDEVYEHIVYAPHQHIYASSLPGGRERVVMCSSLSKTYAITGWRLGYVVGSCEVIQAVRKVHDFLTVGAAAPLQQAAVTALSFPIAYYDRLRDEYASRRDVLLGYLRQTGLKYTTPQGAYYVMVDVTPLGFANDVECCEWMAREIGVAPVPGSSFFAREEHRYVRLHFAKQETTLHQAGERLLRIRERR